MSLNARRRSPGHLAPGPPRGPGPGAEVGGQREHPRPEPVARPGRRAQQALARLGRIAQPPYMREVTARLDRHHEALRGPGAPVGEGLRAWQPVERAVVLDRGVPAPAGIHPAPRRHPPREHHAPPTSPPPPTTPPPT